ncbi:hypothetical protein FRC06_010253 [Ceratobasidium sp. 370]|nr:hypothetical protein FRC06_010253 [Ceratobasidium sp. 370]
MRNPTNAHLHARARARHLFAEASQPPLHGIVQLASSESVTRQSEHIARHAPPASRPTHELLDDDEEMLVRAEAFAQLKWLMVNNVATARGKSKELMHPFVENVHEFVHLLLDQQMIQENLNRFALLYPNNFHCTTYCPRKGHYESPELSRAIAVTFFQGPSSVGMMFPDYFQDMPLTVVAFVLAIWQFCIEEWSNRWHQNGDLGMGAMREKYEGHLANLKELRDIAPRRMAKLQTKWHKYVEEYSGVSFTNTEGNQAGGLHPSEMRPDTPGPDMDEVDPIETQDWMSVDALNETARQESMRDRMRKIIAHEEREAQASTPTYNDDNNDESRAQTPHSVHLRSPSPATTEYNEHGRLTTRSKGKG